MLSQRNFLPDNPSSLFPVHRLLHSTHPKWTPDRRGYARLLSSLKIQVPRCCVMVDYFENSLPHRIFATCLKTKIPPPPHPPPATPHKRAKSTRKFRWRQRLDVSDSGRTSFPCLLKKTKGGSVYRVEWKGAIAYLAPCKGIRNPGLENPNYNLRNPESH